MLIVRTPYRLSLFGGGTDFPSYFNDHGGCVFSTAIDKYIYVIIKSRLDNKTRVSCTHIQTVNNIENLRHELIRESIKKTGIGRGIEIYTIGDIPAGTGLGSSSSVTVGLLKAMYEYMGNSVSYEKLARDACEIEIDILKKPIGIQDQYIASYGGFRFFGFTSKGVDVSVNFDGRLLNERLMMFFTGITRKSETILSEQTKLVKTNTLLLNELKKIAKLAVREYSIGNYDSLGLLLDESWKIKKSLATDISNDKLDHMYDLAKKAGALGGKIAGAGGGGYLLLYVKPENKESVRRAMEGFPELSFKFEPHGSRVVFQ
jgi:D-glycero-alpha-D-manno-heptose-7-phosphate kinase